MNNYLFIIAILFCSNNLFGQSIQLDLKDISLDQLLEIEHSLNSQRIENTSNYISSKALAQPIIFKRKSEIIPDLEVQYFFYEADSAMHKILYEWDLSNFEKERDNPQDSTFLMAMINQFNSLNRLIDSTFQSSSSTDATLDLETITNGSRGMKITNEWSPNQSLEITNHMTLKNKFKKTNSISTFPTVHKIRLYVEKIIPDPNAQLNPKLKENLEFISKSFIKDTKENPEESLKYLSSFIREKTTSKEMNALKSLFDDCKSFKVSSTGTEIGQDYQFPFIILSTKSKSEKKVMNFKFVFDDKDKIVAIKY